MTSSATDGSSAAGAAEAAFQVEGQVESNARPKLGDILFTPNVMLSNSKGQFVLENKTKKYKHLYVCMYFYMCVANMKWTAYISIGIYRI